MADKSKIFLLVSAILALMLMLPVSPVEASSLRGKGRSANWSGNSESLASSPNNRKSRLFNLLFVIRFPNDVCNGTNSLSGTCYTAQECTDRGGTASGACARGYGVCCTFVLQSCGNSSRENCTYFQNPGFPSTYNVAQTCSIFITKKDQNICQFKFDLLTFDTTPPNAGACDMDRFTISGQDVNSVFPPLCGLNSGQSVYADVASSQGPIILSMTTAGTTARSWNIKITQIRCDDANRAPANCLQYFTGASGTIKSFNYATTTAGTLGYPNNLRYSICIRKEMGFCDISFTNPAGMTFHIDGAPAGQSGVGAANCPNDFLIIGSVRYCSERLNPVSAQAVDAPVTDMTNGPFVVEFISDATVTQRGFMLDYTQMACVMG